MGVFELEEGYDILKASFAGEGGLDFNMDQLLDFTQQIEGVLKANNVERRQHDFSGKPSGGVVEVQQQHQQ